MYKATKYIALSLFATISNTYAEEPLIDRMESGLGTIKFCIKQVNNDPELLRMDLVYDRDIEQCKKAEVAIIKFANGLLSKEDVKRLQGTAFIRSELITKIGGMDVVPGQMQNLAFEKKFELLNFCRKRCETVVTAQETAD